MQYKFSLTGMSLKNKHLQVVDNSGKTIMVRLQCRPILTLLFISQELKMEYFINQLNPVSNLKLTFFRHLNFCKTHLRQGVMETFLYYTAKIKTKEKLKFPIQVSVYEHSKKVWISRTAVVNGVFPHSLNAEIEYDRFRKPEKFSAFLWRVIEISSNKTKRDCDLVSARGILTNINNPTNNNILHYSCFAHASVIHGSIALLSDNSVHSISNHGDFENNSWPTDVVFRSRDGDYYFNTYESIDIDKSVFFGSSSNWYHFLVEIMPRFVLYGIPNINNIRIILSTNAQSEIIAICKDLTGLDPILVGPGQKVNVQELLTCTDYRYDDRFNVTERKDDLLGVRDYLMKKYFILNSESPKKIFVYREGNLYRKLINKNRICKKLQDKGFIIVNPASMSIREQVNLFGNASIIVAEHGAGLTNVMFAKKSTIVIEIYPGLNYNGLLEEFSSIFVSNFAAIPRERKKIPDFFRRSDAYRVNVKKILKSISNFEN